MVQLVIHELVLDGQINANGKNSDDTGNPCGAGGTVLIDADLMSGSGSIWTFGRRPRSCSSSRNVGAEAGGRVAIYADVLTGFDPVGQVLANGQALKDCSFNRIKSAGAGTIYVLSAASTYGDLIVDAEGEAGATVATTLLPVIGGGTVGTADPDASAPADLWIEPDDPSYLFRAGVEGA